MTFVVFDVMVAEFHFDQRQQKAAILICLVFLTVLLFGLFNETRVLLSLLPLFIFLWFSDRGYREDLRT